jgi:chromosome partitioning protein
LQYGGVAVGEIIAIVNQKGGVAKTTTACALGCGLAARKKKILFVDLDGQVNLTNTLQAESGPEHASSFEVLTGAATAEEATQKIGKWHVISGSPSLAEANFAMPQKGREFSLKNALAPMKGLYDYIILDTPPSLGYLTINALAACDSIIITAQADKYSLQGIGQLTLTLQAVKSRANPQIEIKGILLTRHNPRTVLTREISAMIEETAKNLATKVFRTTIRDAVAVREAQALEMDIFTYAPKSKVADDYRAFVKEVLK